ncbi:B3 domain-containing protein [Zea mays]|uniref:B3 domain-containing protein n=3 Tax=Zea mays TaxID=4577 RepID=A0A1D6KXR4_MAIZE|nr:uncharacterized protein LOC103643733 isoform X2 [Zea mays]ONM07242.1 B3 domain-containing protein [Zea mays]PWZ53930.1 B3 domain-containing protein [Zea mays]|eukprot:XP_008665132.1 uncharacterized protein LOC103643733 isoform X2 [Zea mays]
MNTVCEVCGDIGYRQLLLCCRDCKRCAVHQYCLDKVVYEASLIKWFCYECLQRRGEVTRISSLEKLSSERPLSQVHSRSPVQQLITKSVESVRDAGPWRDRKNESIATKYPSLNRTYPSIKKHTKKKPIVKPMGNCTNRKVRMAKVTTHTSAEASRSCETIGTESSKSNHGKNQQVDHANPVALNTEQSFPLIVNSLGTLGDNHQYHLLETTEGLACKFKKVPQSLAAPLKRLEKRDNVVLGSNNLGSSCFTADLGSSVLGKSGDKSNRMKDIGANLSSKHNDHGNQANQHTLVGSKNMEGKSVKAKHTVVDAHKNTSWTVDSLINVKDKSEVYGDSNRDILNDVTVQLDHRASNELLPRSTATNIPQLATLENDVVDTVMPYSPNGGCEESFSCPGIKNTPSVRERSVDPINISSDSHDTIEASESSERFMECQKASLCRRRKTVKMAMVSSSSEESGEDTISENVSLGYVLACRSSLSKAQKKRVTKLIQEIQPEFTVFISIMRMSNVKLPGPLLGITKEYAIAHFPDKTTNVTLETPGKSKKWHPKFYKRDESRKNLLMGQWLDFVRDNHVQEGDICLFLPTKDEIRHTFMVYILHETTHSRCGAGFQRVGPCLGGASSAKMASEVHIEDEPTAGEHVSSDSDMPENSHEPLESGDSDDPFEPPYFVPCRSPLSKSQKRMVEQRVRAIRSEVPICVAVMKNNNVGIAQRWMLELCSRYASVYLPTKGQNILLQCKGKTWEAKMMFHNGRRWFLNGGWPDFARGNGLRVGDMCLFELKKKKSTLTMAVHIIRKEQF